MIRKIEVITHTMNKNQMTALMARPPISQVAAILRKVIENGEKVYD